ncbi:hypothetical protein OpiT1DRAFT_05517 [Opitutaceae bacterium TAV1]|nr:hypothetical protein OpiT1DRAFT_05517 [Opitutaceae bacterium TAV1]
MKIPMQTGEILAPIRKPRLPGENESSMKSAAAPAPMKY